MVIAALFVETFVGRWIFPLYIVTSYIIGYYVGVIAFKHYTTEPYNKSDIIRGSILVVVTAFSILVSIYLSYHKMFKGITYIFTNMFFSLSGVSFVLLFLFAFKWLNKKEQFTFLTISDYLSYPAFLLNQVFMVGATNIASLIPQLPLKFAIVLIFVLLFSLGVYYLTYLLDKKVLYRFKKEEKST